MNKIIVENELYYCVHLSKEDLPEIMNSFSVREEGGFLSGYLKKRAYRDEMSNLSKTYIVKDKTDDAIVAYFSLKAGFIAINSYFAQFDSEPGVEVANFAVNKEYITTHAYAKGIGQVIFLDMIRPIIQRASEYIGISIIYIFALPNEKLLKRYKSYGFERLKLSQERRMHKRIRPAYDRGCIFMYQPL